MVESFSQTDAGPGALPGFKWWRTTANSLREESPEIFTASGAVALQKLDNSCITSWKFLDLHPRIFRFLPAG